MKKEEKALSRNHIREHNVKLIINLLQKKPYSCLELAQEIDITDVGVNKIIKQLLAFGMVKRYVETETNRTIGGQHIRYTLNPNIGIYIGCDFTEYRDTAFICDFAGNLLKEIELNISRSAEKAEIHQAIKEIRTAVDAIIANYDNRILAVGLATPGQVNENNNEFIYSGKFHKFEKDELYRLFYDEFQSYVIMKNNVHIMAIGEHDKGNLDNKYNIAVYTYLGGGISSCVLYNGTFISGWRGSSGEIGKNIIADTSLENIASLNKIREKIEAIVNRKIKYNEMFNLFKENADVHKVVIQAAEAVGIFIVNASNLIGCNLFMISGDSLNFGDEYFMRIAQYVEAHTICDAKVIRYKEEKPVVLGTLKLLKDYAVVNYFREKQMQIIE